MRSITEIISLAKGKNISLPEAILHLETEATGLSREEIKEKIHSRLMDMEQSVKEAEENKLPCKLVLNKGKQIRNYAEKNKTLSGSFVIKASEIAIEVASYNATMGRIVAAPTAGSCGILPGLLFAWKKLNATGTKEEIDEKLTNALIIAGAVGEVIAERATLAGAEGGCQAECGAATAMASASLVYLQGGNEEQLENAVSLTLKSILGLVCDPVGGLVEVPCIKRNGMLCSMGALSADMALAGIVSIIPADEVIDTMSSVGKSMPATLRETALGGLAVTPTAKRLINNLKNKCNS
ncbi:MAG: L-serine ammonia-lyase, iron-sulfur-dependent, subunit alpha [Synergistaceae bacterium]